MLKKKQPYGDDHSIMGEDDSPHEGGTNREKQDKTSKGGRAKDQQKALHKIKLATDDQDDNDVSDIGEDVKPNRPHDSRRESKQQ